MEKCQVMEGIGSDYQTHQMSCRIFKQRIDYSSCETGSFRSRFLHIDNEILWHRCDAIDDVMSIHPTTRRA